MLEAWFVGVVVGAVSEITARALHLWRYRSPIYPAVNIVLMFGVVMGGLSLLVPPLGWGLVCFIGLAIGYAYEWVNFVVLDWWHFPGDRFLAFRGKQGCALSVAVLWGTVPVVNHVVRQALG